jgi:hypothetical protein
MQLVLNIFVMPWPMMIGLAKTIFFVDKFGIMKLTQNRISEIEGNDIITGTCYVGDKDG